MSNDPEEYDIREAMAPKSDQMNADDLIGGPATVEIIGVKVRKGTGQKGEQLVDVIVSGGFKPYRPCKGMMRVISDKWGTNAAKWIGKSITLYRDPTVSFGGDQVGGIRISHMSHIDKRNTIALTVTRGNRKPYTVEPLKLPEPAASTTADPTETLRRWIGAAIKTHGWTADKVTALLIANGSTDGKAATLPADKHAAVIALLKAPPVAERAPSPDDGVPDDAGVADY
jgi:hypothetical protein